METNCGNLAIALLATTGAGIASVVNFGQQPFVFTNLLLVTKVSIEELEEYQAAGGYFYDEVNQQAVRGSDLRKRFGISSADKSSWHL